MKIDVSDLVQHLKADVDAVIEDAERETERMADVVLEVAREATPVRSGKLKAGWKKRKEANATYIENDVPYAGHVDQGTARMAGAHMTDKAVDAAVRGGK